eukprot:1732424-Pyramimonas_sp.AAC.1
MMLCESSSVRFVKGFTVTCTSCLLFSSSAYKILRSSRRAVPLPHPQPFLSCCRLPREEEGGEERGRWNPGRWIRRKRRDEGGENMEEGEGRREQEEEEGAGGAGGGEAGGAVGSEEA